VPKSAGSSVGAALLAAFPGARVSRMVQDTSNIACGFTAFDELGEEARASLAVSDQEVQELSRSGLVSGHFCLPTLLRLAPPSSIGTVLREPRARLLSLYAWMRLTTRLHEVWHPYPAFAHALRPLDEFLAEPLLAKITDNALCRMLLYGDPRIPALDFIAPADLAGLATDAIERLDKLGFVGILERGQATWDGLSRFFDARLEPTRVNETASETASERPLPIKVSEHTLSLLDARCEADALVYDHALITDRADVAPAQTRDAAFAAQLIRVGDLTGRSAASAQSLAARNAELESQVAALAAEAGRLQDDLALRETWLDGVQGSISWRITRPLRAVKRYVVGLASR
jgi:hypothetical protein